MGLARHRRGPRRAPGGSAGRFLPCPSLLLSLGTEPAPGQLRCAAASRRRYGSSPWR
jgi:hypothetical protein